MKRILTILPAIFISILASNVQAQLLMPQASSSQTVIQGFGLGNVTVKYSRPSVKGRTIFSGLVPYGEVWRTGANSATIITFSDDVTLEGKPVAAGEYGLFTIPGKDTWTIILNKGAQQWGAYEYKQADDVLRFQVKPQTSTEKTETFTISFSDVLPSTAKLNLTWDKTKVSVNMATDVDSRVMANIDAAMKGDKKPYVQAAQYYYDNGKDINKALEWINAAEAADQKAPWIKYWKSRIQLKAGDKSGAALTARAGIKAAEAMNNQEYIRLNNNILTEATK